MEGDQIGAGLGEVGDDAVDRAHHQVHIDRHRLAVALGVRADRLADQRADRQVRHVVVVHHIEVDPVGAALDHAAYLLAQAGKIG